MRVTCAQTARNLQLSAVSATLAITWVPTAPRTQQLAPSERRSARGPVTSSHARLALQPVPQLSMLP
eukprot:scaffold57469_cov77-Phaeocystis_antarctica.AAC.1